VPQSARVPLYRQVADDLRRQIENGDLAPGARLPSEPELDARYDVSRGTTRQAVLQLVVEGLVVTRQGRGTFVRSGGGLIWHVSRYEGTDRRDTFEMDDWSAGVLEQGHTPRQEVEVSILAPPPMIAERLRTPAGDLCVLRRRIRYVDDQPANLADSWFPEALVRGTPLMEPRDVATPGGVLAHIGTPQHRVQDEILPRMPTQDESRRLRIEPGTAVVEHVRTGYSVDDEPVRVMVTVVPAGGTTLVY
jgi:DNA-binding GntR family transcriptional regulator